MMKVEESGAVVWEKSAQYDRNVDIEWKHDGREQVLRDGETRCRDGSGRSLGFPNGKCHLSSGFEDRNSFGRGETQQRENKNVLLRSIVKHIDEREKSGIEVFTY